MNKLTVFENRNFGSVRTVTIDGVPYFVANDVVSALGYKNPSKTISDHCRGVTKRYIGVVTGIKGDGSEAVQEIEMSVIPESDIYRLIIRSKLPAAQEFESWVCDEVLPSIRKHGGYLTEEKLEEALSDPDTLIRLATDLKAERERRKALEAEKRALVGTISELRDESEYKSEVIAGMLPQVDLYQKRVVLNRVVRHKGADFRARWAELYRVFKATFHCDLKARCEGHNKTLPKSKHLSVVKYAEQFGHLDNLYTVAVKLYETDIDEILAQLRKIA